VPVYPERGTSRSSGRGLFTSILMRTYPLLPVEEEGTLCNPVLRENFLERVMVYERWQALLDSGFTVAKLIDFHSCYKLLILSHNQAAYRRLGRAVAQAHSRNLQQTAEFYGDALMNAIKRPADRANHVNVLRHLAGYLRKVLDSQEKQKLQSILEKYRNGRLPLIAPLTLMRDHFRRYPNPSVARQVYLDWYGDARDLMLKNRE
ncbi:MAG: YbgA family protein, partial [Methylococcales bacterium]